MKATVGRKLWFYPGAGSGIPTLGQPLDATVVFVHASGRVNLVVHDPYGNAFPCRNVRLIDPDVDSAPRDPDEDTAEWMPYQVGQARQGQQFDVSTQYPGGSRQALNELPRIDAQLLGGQATGAAVISSDAAATVFVQGGDTLGGELVDTVVPAEAGQQQSGES